MIGVVYPVMKEISYLKDNAHISVLIDIMVILMITNVNLAMIVVELVVVLKLLNVPLALLLNSLLMNLKVIVNLNVQKDNMVMNSKDFVKIVMKVVKSVLISVKLILSAKLITMLVA